MGLALLNWVAACATNIQCLNGAVKYMRTRAHRISEEKGVHIGVASIQIFSELNGGTKKQQVLEQRGSYHVVDETLGLVVPLYLLERWRSERAVQQLMDHILQECRA